MALIQSMEKESSCDTPLLVFTDMEVVDENLKIIYPSFRKSAHLDITRTRPENLIIQNILSGNTMLMNKALAQMVRTYPNEALMHDWWVALIASVFGKIGYLKKSTMKYRQHGSNAVGTKKESMRKYLLSAWRNRNFHKETLRGTFRQAEAFLNRYGSMMNAADKELFTRYAAIPKKKFKLLRYITLLQLGVTKDGLIKNIFCLAFI